MKQDLLMRCGAWMIGVCAALTGLAQEKQLLTPSQYQQMKESGSLPSLFQVAHPAQSPVKPKVHKSPGVLKGGGNSDCDCWIEPDASYTLAMAPNDDGSSPPIVLPFIFNLYSELYSTVYINNNGNVSFDFPYGTYTPAGFPNPSFKMVAPFWADVDTRGIGQVLYKVTPTALYVNWVDVGYFNTQTDKIANFQLIITNGSDPVIGVGKNVSFCYKDMQWTTGSASCVGNNPCSNSLGTFSCSNSGGFGYGFCGAPALNGANRGNGVDYIQFGTYDRPGFAYDGPAGATDEVDWLDYKNFVFTTQVSTSNIPPIANSALLCDTLRICAGELVQLDMSFLAPEAGQTVVATSSAPTLSTYTEVNNVSGINALIQSEFIPTPAEVGFHSIAYEATDNGVPPLTTYVDIVIEVVPSPGGPPVITGTSTICTGATTTLAATGGPYDNLLWSNGATGTTVQVGPGTYTVVGFTGGCSLISDPFVVTGLPLPQPQITGVLFNCGGAPTTLSTDQPYASYSWSNGATTPSITAGTGNYSVTVTDANGCAGTSAAVNVLIAPDPTASFITDPLSPQQPGVEVDLASTSSGNGGTIPNPAGYAWDFGNGQTATGQSVSITYPVPGIYTITLTVTTTDGCTDVATWTYVVQPQEIFVPNVFSPNGDGYNDELEFVNLQYYDGAHLIVYSRWGNVVYENFSYKNTWRAQGVSDGTYFFVLTLKDGRQYSGHVTLLR
ncbi:MAG: gliding motility-associated C-terminal domain-containing protein [Flavobacteriales bacterium]|nr:gliding motility-associated C-terminal domain-containing protein [Flavobacteriales bacterium]